MKNYLTIFLVISSFLLLNCQNPNSSDNDDKLRLKITDIPSRYNGCMINVTILDNKDDEVAYCGGNSENGTLITVYATDLNDNYWTGNSNSNYKVSLDFIYNDPDIFGFYYVNAMLSNEISGGTGTIIVSATGTTFNEE